MGNISERKIANIGNLSAADKQDYFLRKVCDFELVWGLYNNGWATVGLEKGIGIPFWPEEIFATLSAKSIWAGYVATSINLSDFIEKWLPGMKKNGELAAIFPWEDKIAEIIEPEQLLLELINEVRQYE